MAFTDLSVSYPGPASPQQPADFHAVIVGLPNLLPPNQPKKKANTKERDILYSHASAGSEGVEPPNQLHSVKTRFEFPMAVWGDDGVRELSAVTGIKS